jgi:hypothetical protein
MSTPKSGNDFEHLDMAGTKQVKESYRAALQEEPRAIIDDAIRAAARRAVSSGPTSIGKTWFNRWTTPLAAAATVMLTSSVIFMAVRDRPEVAPPIADMVAASDKNKVVISEAAKDVVAAAPVLESDAADKRAYAPTPAPAPASTIAAQTLQLNQAKEKKSSVGEPAATPAMTRMQDSSNRATQTPSAPSEVVAPQQKIPPAPAKQTAPIAEMAKATSIATPAAPSTAARKVLNEIKIEAAGDLGAQDAYRRKQSDSEATAALTAQATGKVAPPPPAAANVAGVSAAPPPPQARILAKPTVTEPVMPRADMSPAAPPVVAAPAPAPPPAADTMEKSPATSLRAITNASEKSDKIESADAWIKRMTELKRQEKNKELADEIVRFRKRYPSVELPKELTEAQN